MKEWTKVTRCPKCGGTLVVSDFYTFSREYKVTRKGLLSKRYTKTDAGAIECLNAFCTDCNSIWDASEVCVESSGEVFLRMEEKGEAAE